jgi:pimeloyl-ACP methyl ester carboxylesterase
MSVSRNQSVLLLHGGPALSNYFGPLETVLAERFHVRAYVQTERTIPKLIAQLESHFRVLTLQDGQALLYAAAHAPRPKLLPPKIIVLGSAPLELDTKALFRANLTARIPAKVQAELDRLDEEYDGSEDPALRSRLQIQYQDFITPFYNVDPESTKRLPHSVWDTVLFDAVSEELNAIIEAGTIPKLLSRITVPVVSFHGASDTASSDAGVPTGEFANFSGNHLCRRRPFSVGRTEWNC